MKNLFHILFFFLLFLIASCSSSYNVSSSSEDKSVIEFNESAKGEEAEIIFTNNVEITATDVYLSADSLYWFNPATKLKTGVPKSEIGKVMFTDTWTGGAYGAGAGFIGGVALWVAVNDSMENSQFDSYMGGLAALGIVGAIIGFPVGLIVGYPVEYKFQNVGQARKQ
jgi:hypothetical protein